jgi:hypothetical protein
VFKLDLDSFYVSLYYTDIGFNFLTPYEQMVGLIQHPFDWPEKSCRYGKVALIDQQQD